MIGLCDFNFVIALARMRYTAGIIITRLRLVSTGVEKTDFKYNIVNGKTIQRNNKVSGERMNCLNVLLLPLKRSIILLRIRKQIKGNTKKKITNLELPKANIPKLIIEFGVGGFIHIGPLLR